MIIFLVLLRYQHAIFASFGAGLGSSLRDFLCTEVQVHGCGSFS